MKRRSLLGLIRLAHRVGRPRGWAIPAIIALGLGSAVLEGVGLVLFIPLLESLGAPAQAGGALEQAIARIVSALPSEHQTVILVVILCTTILLKNVVNFARATVTRHMDGDIAHRLRSRIFEQTLTSCVDYASSMKRADISMTLSNSSWRVASALTLFYAMVIAAVMFIVFVGFMSAISPMLTAGAMLFLLLAACALSIATKRAHAIGREVVRENKEFGLRMWESMNNLQLIRAYGRESYERDRFVSSSEQVRRRLLSLDVLWILPGRISEVCIVVLIAGLILTADRSGIGIAALAAFLSLLYRLQGPSRELLECKVAVDGMAGSIEDVADLLERTDKPFLRDGSRAVSPVRQAIVFDRVSFRYGPDEPWAVDDVSFQIPAGKTTAIVGRSGAGKSTITALLCRFYDPERGAILADGVPLAALRLAEWRAQLSLMSQEVQLFNDTIAANIAYGRLEAGHGEISEAARIAHAEGFVNELPQGFDTVVGDHGLRLSGGQRQRIALARSVLRDSNLLLLDEATNALDIDSEHAFQRALNRYSHGRTVVVIAHRLSTVRNADHVIVLGEGKLIEAGPPEQLIRDSGQFARMLDLQHSVVPMEPEYT